MRKHAYNKNTITIVEADEGKYLVLKDLPEDVNFGRPTRIIFDNSAEVPEFEEREV